MTEFVLDASAVLAVLHGEPGADRVIDIIEQASISVVNVAEIAAKLQERGMPNDRVRANIAALNLRVAPFDQEAAIATGLMRAATRKAGLSLGDRACLTLAASIGAIAVTTDRAWQNLELGIAVDLVR